MKKNSHIPLEADRIYHVFNRAIADEKLFLTEDNYHYFLDKMKQHILPVADIIAYSLMPNHFHLVIKIKPITILKRYYQERKERDIDDENTKLISDFVMERFSNWLNAYVKAYNKVHKRKGALFLDYTKRSLANTDDDVTAFIFYVHKNAVHHGLSKKIGEWRFDSYNSIISTNPTSIAREFTLTWFYTKEKFIEFHSHPVSLKNLNLED